MLVTDPSAAVAARQDGALAMALSAFLACHDLADVTAAMNTLHTLFAGSLPKVIVGKGRGYITGFQTLDCMPNEGQTDYVSKS